MEDRLIELIQDAVHGCSRYWASVIAEHLIANGVSFGRDPGYGWIPTSLGLPDRSGYYLALTERGNINTLPYSAIHKAFNSFDCELKPNFEIPVVYWMPLPEPPGEVKNCFK